ncbi:hypothetical protein T08_6968 [Trichinella sp. T8]|nr:hypothetical protein T08_6968 [Trichinella sp. T8]
MNCDKNFGPVSRCTSAVLDDVSTVNPTLAGHIPGVALINNAFNYWQVTFWWQNFQRTKMKPGRNYRTRYRASPNSIHPAMLHCLSVTSDNFIIARPLTGLLLHSHPTGTS